MALFDTDLPHPPQEQITAMVLLNEINQEILHRIQIHKDSFQKFWYPTDGTTPEGIAAAMGTNGAVFLALSQESIRHILTGLTILGVDPEAEAGTTTTRFAAVEYTPPRSITANEDGTLTIGPAEVNDQ